MTHSSWVQATTPLPAAHDPGLSGCAEGVRSRNAVAWTGACSGRARAPSNSRLLRSLSDAVAASRDLGVNLERRDFSKEALKPSSSSSSVPPCPGPCTAQSCANWAASATVSLPPGLRPCPADSARALRWSCEVHEEGAVSRNLGLQGSGLRGGRWGGAQCSTGHATQHRFRPSQGERTNDHPCKQNGTFLWLRGATLAVHPPQTCRHSLSAPQLMLHVAVYVGVCRDPIRVWPMRQRHLQLARHAHDALQLDRAHILQLPAPRVRAEHDLRKRPPTSA